MACRALGRNARLMMRILATGALVALASTAAAAQSIETPQAFDAAHRVMAVTPGLADRLHLTPPLWPAAAPYREVRLYAVQPGGGFVLVVLRPTGVLERYALTDAQRSALETTIDSAESVSGRPGGEISADIVSEPAGNAFARTQGLLGVTVYGPIAASLADDANVGTGLYLLVAGGSFFVAYGSAQQEPFTRAQSDLAAGLGLAAGTGGWLAGYAASGASDKSVRVLSLASAFAGTIAGAQIGRTLSDAEAHGGVFGLETGAAFALDASAIAGLSGRAAAAFATVGGAAGLPLGLGYPRHAAYNVTAGDAQSIGTAGLVGAVVGGAVGIGKHASARQTELALTTGYLAGELVGERALARPLDLTQSQANLLKLGAFAGALLGVAVPTLGGSENMHLVLGAAGAGAALAVAGLAASFPSHAESVGAPARTGSGSRSTSRITFDVPTASIFGLAARRRGEYPLLRVTF